MKQFDCDRVIRLAHMKLRIRSLKRGQSKGHRTGLPDKVGGIENRLRLNHVNCDECMPAV